MKKFFLLIGILFMSVSLWAADNPDAILGVWKNETGKGYIQIYRQSGKYYGKISWLQDAKDANGQTKTDKRNQNPALRVKPLIGLVMLYNFKYDDGEWNGGHIYNPQDGKEYKGYIKLKDMNTLVVRGYVGFTFIGKSDIWTRVSG